MKKVFFLTVFFLAVIAWGAQKPIFAQPILSGAGATFPSPLYFKWFDEFSKKSSLRISYRETGSSEGLRLLLAQEVDFGASDVYPPQGRLPQALEKLLFIPTCVGAVAIIYNLEGDPAVRLTPSLLADIFLGRITSWADERIQRVNPGVRIRPLAITVVHRSEGSGTTFLLADYLSQVSSDWKQSVGAGQIIRWPAGLGVQENAGVAALVKKIPGSIGYVSLNYAMQNRIATAFLQNASGYFVRPSVRSVSAAATVEQPASISMRITNSPFDHAYPICGFTYIVVFQDQFYRNRSREQASALVDFLKWSVRDGQRYAEPLFYAPLSKEVISYVERLIDSITYKGKPLL